jgi:MAF protein
MLPLVLASSSVYRRELLQRLNLSFSCCSPDIDEQRLPNESARHMVCRLAKEKALAVSASHRQHLIIGSDQVAVLGEEILGKPQNLQRATTQLRAASGNPVTFLTGLALLNSQTGHCQVDCIPFTVHFRVLDDSRIRRYLETEQPFDCAGSFKSEGLGVSLFRSTEGCDATSLIGLPLIRLIDMLGNEGITIP